MTAPPSTRAKINQARQTLGWSCYKLAAESGVARSTVEKYCNGSMDTTTAKADKMMKAMEQRKGLR